MHGWILIRAFLVAALRPGCPLPILVAKGEQGAGKSTACRVLSSLIDPRTSALRGVPREVRDLTAAARNSWLVCFDNLGRLPEDLADAACRLATGGGFGGPQLYSAARPLVFKAIPDLGQESTSCSSSTIHSWPGSFEGRRTMDSRMYGILKPR